MCYIGEITCFFFVFVNSYRKFFKVEPPCSNGMVAPAGLDFPHDRMTDRGFAQHVNAIHTTSFERCIAHLFWLVMVYIYIYVYLTNAYRCLRPSCKYRLLRAVVAARREGRAAAARDKVHPEGYPYSCERWSWLKAIFGLWRPTCGCALFVFVCVCGGQ